MPTSPNPRQKVQTAPRPKSDLDLARLGTLAEWFLINDPEWLSDALSLRLETIMRQEQTAHKQLEASMYARRQNADAEQSRMRNTSLPFRLRSQVIVLPKIAPSDNQDCFSALPTDLRLEILSYLFKPHVDPPENQRSDTDQDAHQHQPPHPLNQLASVSRTWRDQVETFSSSQLIVWKQQVAKCVEDSWMPWRCLRTYTSSARMELVVRQTQSCVCRGRWSYRAARWWEGLRCCGDCERVEDERRRGEGEGGREEESEEEREEREDERWWM